MGEIDLAIADYSVALELDLKSGSDKDASDEKKAPLQQIEQPSSSKQEKQLSNPYLAAKAV